MKFGMYVVRDDRTGYLTPTFDYNDSAAVRNFQHAVNATEGIMNSHREDFSLFKIGFYDNEKGLVEVLPEKEFLFEGADIVD